MLKNYFKIAFRHLRRSKTYSFINIISFAVSLACAILVLLYVQNQLSFDRFNKHAGRIYRVIKYMDFNGKKTVTPITGAPVAGTLAREIPGVEEATRLFPARSYWNCSVGYKGKVFPEKRFFFAAGLTLAAALITTGFQALRAAATNPINSLRYE